MNNSPETPTQPATGAESAPTPEATPPTVSYVDRAKSADDFERRGIKYRTENIGKWNAKQENPFAAQNRKVDAERAERAAKQSEVKKIVMPIAIVLGSLATIGLIVLGAIALNNYLNPPEPPIEITGTSVEATDEYRNALQNIFNQSVANQLGLNGNKYAPGDDGKVPNISYDTNVSPNQENIDQALAAIDEAINNTLQTDNGQRYASAIRLAEMQLLRDNKLCQKAIDKGMEINPSNLDLDQQITYHGELYYCYTVLGKEEDAMREKRKQYTLTIERGGDGG